MLTIWTTLGYTPSVSTKKPSSLPDLLRSLREQSGRSLREAARDLQVDPGHLSRIERGEKAGSLDLQLKAARYYDVPEDEVLLASGGLPPDIVAILRTHPEAIQELRNRYGKA